MKLKAGLDRLVGRLEDENAYEQYINSSIKGKNITVQAFSSIDAKSDEIGGGSVPGCKGGEVIRKEYNLCLSQKRAETIVNYLNSEFPEIFGDANLIAKGMGELKSKNSVNLPYSDPKQKAHRDSKRISTREDRKFTIKMPEFTITKFD